MNAITPSINKNGPAVNKIVYKICTTLHSFYKSLKKKTQHNFTKLLKPFTQFDKSFTQLMKNKHYTTTKI